MEYGYITKDGFLRSQEIKEYQTQYNDGGEIKTRTVTVEEQIDALSAEWKEVDPIDNEQLNAPDGYCVRIIPFDAGDRISFKYEQIQDKQKIKREIADLKSELSGSDYKVIKCYEAQLSGEPLPYDLVTLHNERDQIRAKINELERIL